jgi:hypothetical protein
MRLYLLITDEGDGHRDCRRVFTQEAFDRGARKVTV